MGLIKIMTAFLFTGLFAFALIMFATTFASNNDSSVNIGNDAEFSSLIVNTQSDVDTLYLQSNVSANAMQESTIASTTDATEGGTSYKVGPWDSLTLAKRTLDVGFAKVFGSDNAFEIFFTAIVLMLGFMVTMYIGKAWKGQPD